MFWSSWTNYTQTLTVVIILSRLTSFLLPQIWQIVYPSGRSAIWTAIIIAQHWWPFTAKGRQNPQHCCCGGCFARISFRYHLDQLRRHSIACTGLPVLRGWCRPYTPVCSDLWFMALIITVQLDHYKPGAWAGTGFPGTHLDQRRSMYGFRTWFCQRVLVAVPPVSSTGFWISISNINGLAGQILFKL